jgi:outer membrane receptor for ferrienterochelin and colicins
MTEQNIYPRPPKRYTRKLCAITLTLSLLARITAQETDDYDLFFDDDDGITITGTRSEKRLADSPVVTEIISAEEIALSDAATVIDVLSDYGLVFRGNGSSDYVQMQGMDKGRILFLINGRRVIGRNSQRLNGETLPIGNIDRIEIVRGAQSALYGSDGMGGVINIITKKPEDAASFSVALTNQAELPFKTDGNASPFREQNLALTAGGPLGAWRNSLNIGAARAAFYLDEDGVSLLPEHYRGNLAFDATRLLDTLTSGAELRLGGSIMAMRRENRTSASGNLGRLDYLRAALYAETEFLPAESSQLTLRLYDNFYQRDNDTYAADSDAWTTGKNHEYENLAAFETVALLEGAAGFLFTAGLEAAYNNMEKASLSRPYVDKDTEALFGQLEYAETNAYSLLAGLRLERDSGFGVAVAPKFSGMYHLSADFRVLGGVALGYRAPSFNDLYQDFQNTTQHIRGNPNLRPEYSLNFNTALEWARGKSFAQINVYYHELFDEIDTFIVETIGKQRVYDTRNITRSLRLGVDTEARLTFFSSWYVSAGYNWLYAWDRSAGEELFIQPAHTARLKAGFSHKSGGNDLHVYVQARYFSAFPMVIGGVSSILEPRFILDFYASLALGKQLTISAGMDNITGTTDATLGPFTAQRFSTGVKYTWE